MLNGSNQANGIAGAQNARSLSRIENDVEVVKQLTNSVEITTERITRHARSLGYFEPPQDPKTQAPTPVITTLADALQALSRAIDHAAGSLNVFD